VHAETRFVLEDGRWRASRAAPSSSLQA